MPDNSLRVYEQIEQTADFHGPSTYDLLTYFNVLKTEADPLGPDFIPLSQVKPRARKDAKLFVIGILPPTSYISGRLIDRSATVASLQGFADPASIALDSAAQNPSATAVPAKGSPIVTLPGYQLPPMGGTFNPQVGYPTAGVAEPDPVITKLSAVQVYQAIYDAYTRKFGRPPSPTECWIYTAQSIRETSGNWPNNNPGYIGNFPSYKPGTFSAVSQTGGRNKGYYTSYPSTEAGADAFVAHVTRNPNVVQAAQSGDVLGYTTSLAQSLYYDASIKTYYDAFPAIMQNVAAQLQKAGAPPFPSAAGLPKAPATCGMTEDIIQYRERVGLRKNGKDVNLKGVGIARALATSKYEGCPLLPDGSGEGGSAVPWATEGAANAQQAQQSLAERSNRDLNQSDLGKALSAQQRAMQRALQITLDQMAATPPLRMLINPASFKVAEEKVISEGNWGRNGMVVEHWGEAQPKISASGKVAGFFAMDAAGTTLGSPGNSPGLTRMARNFSAGYQNFLSLYLLYRNNGAAWLNDFADPAVSKPNNLTVVGSIYIYYDNTLYIGSFDSFNVSEAEDKPFSLEYDFEFTVRSIFLLDRQTDLKLSYGAPELFTLQNQTLPSKQSETVIGDTGLLGPSVSAAQVAEFERQIQEEGALEQQRRSLKNKDPGNVFADPPLSNNELAQQIFPGDTRRQQAVASAQAFAILPKKKKLCPAARSKVPTPPGFDPRWCTPPIRWCTSTGRWSCGGAPRAAGPLTSTST